MVCYKHANVKKIRDEVEKATGVSIPVSKWHKVGADSGMSLKSPAPADPEQAIAAAVNMYTQLNIHPNLNPEAQKFLNALETGEITLTKGQAEKLRCIPAYIRETVNTPTTTPPEIEELVDEINQNLTGIEFEDHSGTYEPQDIFNIHDVSDSNATKQTISETLQTFLPHTEVNSVAFTHTAITVNDLNPSSPEDYIMDGDPDGYENVMELVNGYENGDDIPPIVILEHDTPDAYGSKYIILDGCHRAAAAREAGIPVLPAYKATIRDPELAEQTGWINLTHVTDPQVARNNCGPATWAVGEKLREETQMKVSDTQLLFEGGVHWANTVTTPNGEKWVVDYTAKQFDSNAPTPLIMPHATWKMWVGDKIMDKHGQMLIEETN